MDSNITVVPSRLPFSGVSGPSGILAPPVEGGAWGTRAEEGERILIVEDDVLVASQMETALTDAGFQVAGTAVTSTEALQLAQAELPILVVMDIRLADGRDGIDTALELFRTHGIRCIFASAFSDQEARPRAGAAAPRRWLQKPYTMASLTAMVRAAVSELRGPRD
jgi:DNA-binding response OmpR family regulator